MAILDELLARLLGGGAPDPVAGIAGNWRGPDSEPNRRMPVAPQGAPPAAFAEQAAPMPQGAPAGPQPSGGGGFDQFLGGIFGGVGGKGKTIKYLMDQGLDEGTAYIVANDKAVLQDYLRQKVGGNKPIEINGRLVDPNTYDVLADFSDQKSDATDDIQEYQYAVQSGQFTGTFPEWQTKGIREQDPTFGREMDLRKEYEANPVLKDYQIVRSNYERIRQGAQMGTGAGDTAVVFGYMKMLDPTSVVREGEQANAQNAAGVPEGIRGQYNRLIGGGTLSAEARRQMIEAAGKVYQESATNIKDLNKRYSGIAGYHKLDPSRILQEPESYGSIAIYSGEEPEGLPLPPPDAITPPPTRRRLKFNPKTGGFE